LLLRHPLAQRGLRHFAAGTFGVELILDSLTLSGFCRLLWLRCGELAHGHGLLHDDLVFAAVLVSKIGNFVPELGYECVAVGIYPFVYPTVYPGVQIDVHAPVLRFIVLESAPPNPFADSALGDA
jgi:hypothetical protein